MNNWEFNLLLISRSPISQLAIRSAIRCAVRFPLWKQHAKSVLPIVDWAHRI